MRFAAPAGLLCAAATFAGYYVAHLDTSLTLDQQRTTATLVLVSLGLLILIQLASPMTKLRQLLVGSMVVGFLLVLAVPFGREYFALSLPPPTILLAAVGIVALAWWIMVVAERLSAALPAPLRPAHDGPGPPQRPGVGGSCRAQPGLDLTHRDRRPPVDLRAALGRRRSSRRGSQPGTAHPVTEVLPDAWQPTRLADAADDGGTPVTQPD